MEVQTIKLIRLLENKGFNKADADEFVECLNHTVKEEIKHPVEKLSIRMTGQFKRVHMFMYIIMGLLIALLSKSLGAF